LRTLWQDPEVSTEMILRAAFSRRDDDRPDLKLSVYVIEVNQVDQARAEHLVSFTGSPPSWNSLDLDLQGLATCVRSDGETKFNFTRTAHAELHLADEPALRQLIEAVRTDHRRHIARNQAGVLDYILERQQSRDAQWVVVLAEKPKWTEALAKYQKRVTSASAAD